MTAIVITADPLPSARFHRTGLLALAPYAFGVEFLLAQPCAAEPFTREGPAAVVSISGPITYDGFLFDSYRAIESRVEAALASDACVVVLKINSPGGEVYGAFDTARSLRAKAAAANKRLIAYTDAACCSAAYALACGAGEIWASEVAKVGSIGVIAVACETTAADKAAGINFELITSGARKADGNPHVKFSDEARAAEQRAVTETAEVFYALVKEARPLVKAPQSLEAATFTGVSARAAGLVDNVGSWREMVAALALAPAASQAGAKKSGMAPGAPGALLMDDDKPNDKPDARAALAAAAEAGDPNAKRALAAWDNDKPKAEDEGQPKKDDDDKEKEGKAKAASAAAALAASTETASLSALQSSVTALATSVQALTAKDTAAAAAERATFLATRPDLAKAVVDGLASLPLETLKLAVAAIPVAANPLAPPAGDPKLRGAGAAGVVAVPEAAGMPAAMAAVMGLAQPEKYGVVNDGSLQIFGVPVK